MADTKISALVAVTTPLAGTETLAMVQGGVTKKVTVQEFDDAVSAIGFFHDEYVSGVAQTVFSGFSGTYTIGSNRLQVWKNGILMRKGATEDYQETSSSSITFNFNCDSGDFITIHHV